MHLIVDSESAGESRIIREEDFVREASLDLVLAQVKEASLQEYKASQLGESPFIFTSDFSLILQVKLFLIVERERKKLLNLAPLLLIQILNLKVKGSNKLAFKNLLLVLTSHSCPGLH